MKMQAGIGMIRECEGGRPGTEVPSEPSAGDNLADTWTSDFQPPHLWGNTLLSKAELHQVCGPLFQQPPERGTEAQVGNPFCGGSSLLGVLL